MKTNMEQIKGDAPRLITHFVAGYPNLESSLEIARGLIAGGAFALEIQFPFSDPSADGPIIESACRIALKAGFRLDDGFQLIETITRESEIPLYIMSYGGLLYRMGIEKFLLRASKLGVKGLIVPDLIPGSDEGLYALGKKTGIDIVPVIVPTVKESRLTEIMGEKPEWIYTALRAGITGRYTDLDESNLSFLRLLKKYKVKVMAGFGIRSSEQIHRLSAHCEGQIVGSYLLECTNHALESKESLKDALEQSVKGLIQ